MKEGWKYKRLGEIATYINGFAFKPSDWSIEGIPIIRIQNLTGTQLHFNKCSRKDIPEKYIVRNGDVLISWSATLGVFEWELGDAYLNQHIFKVVFDKEEINKKYFEYAISISINLMFQYTNGATMKHIRKGDFDNIRIPVPPLSEQQAIVSRLDTAFAKIDAVKANAEKQLSDAKALFKKELSEAMMPKEGWTKKKLGEVCVISGDYGLSVSSKPFDGVRYIRITDITEYGELDDDKVSALIDENKKQEKLKDGDILFARTGATVGKTLIYNERYGDCLFAGYLIRYRLDKNIILPQFMYYVTHSSEYYEWVNVNQEAAAQPNISAKKYSSLPISVPPLSEQQAIVTHLDTLSEKLKTVEEKQKTVMAECDAMKQALLREVFE